MGRILDDAALDADLTRWLEQQCGGRLAEVRPVSGGAYRKSCRLEVERADGTPRPYFIKVDLGSAPKTPFNMEREYRLLKRLGETGAEVRAPTVLGYHAPSMTMLMDLLDGEARYDRVEGDGHRQRIERSFTEALAEVHRVAPGTLGLDYMPTGATARQAIAAELDDWQALLLAGVADPDPLTLFSFAWLRAHLPAGDDPAVLVHGDAGPGNFLFDRDRVTGLVDWEMTHQGHPLEDMGCVLARSLVQPMEDPGRLVVLYEEAAGRRWDRSVLLYCTILVMARFSVPIALGLETRATNMDFVLSNSYFRLSQIALLELIADAEGIPLSDAAPADGPDMPIDFELSYVRALLTDIVRPAVSDDYVRYRLDGATGLLSYIAHAEAANRSRQAPPPAPVPAAGRLGAYGALLASGDKGGIAAEIARLHRIARFREELMRDMLGGWYGRRIRL